MDRDAHPGVPDGSGGPHVFVADVAEPELADEDHHHLARSLRVREGDPLTISDGRGAWRPCAFGVRLRPTGEVLHVARPEPALTVGFALTKGAKPELVVQKLTELGIDEVVPFVAERSVVRWDPDKAQRHHDRFERIAREAAMQCRRVWLPRIRPAAEFADLVANGAVLADGSGGSLDATHTTVLIGPEGGWSEGERRAKRAVRLGPHVLRAETAAIAAATLMTWLRG